MSILYSNIIGDGYNHIIILHGLLGMGDNWKTYANKLKNEGYCVHLVDQRNHGRSFHDSEMNFEVMSNDLLKYLQFHEISEVILMGHSMGGKTAMNFTLKYPDLVSKLIVVDISPKYYSVSFDLIFKVLKGINLLKISSRKQLEADLFDKLHDRSIVYFLLKNLYRSDHNFSFRMNLEVLSKNLENLSKEVKINNKFTSPTLFFSGEFSDYISEDDNNLIQNLFPNYNIISVPNAKHWLHAENPEFFYSKLLYFLDNN